MCGIVAYSGTFSRELVERANELQAHRGPDDRGVFFDDRAGVALGHVRLSIIDLSDLAHQPMTAQDGEVVLVFNGEIYNYRELRSELANHGHAFRGHSDTEVLLHMYLEYGDAMLDKLNGIFAFALFDARRNQLFVARDAIGVKPLYFAATARDFAAASELKALLDLVPEVCDLDYESLHRYLTFLWCPGPGTPLRQIRKLGPGEALFVSDGRITRHWQWYKLPGTLGIEPDLSEHEAIEATTQHLRRAVHRQLVADVPVGAFLSGGLDSSAVVTFAREQAPHIHCFTIDTGGFSNDDGFADDLPHARRVAKHLGVPLHEIRVEASTMAADLENMVVQLDEPLADPAPLNVLYISQLARQHGMKVLLSGAGGDDLFTGYRRHLALRYEKYWRWLPTAGRTGLQRVSQRLDRRRPWSRRLAKLFAGASENGDARLTQPFRWASEAELAGLFSEPFASLRDEYDAAAPMLQFLSRVPKHIDPVERMLLLEQRFFLADHNLMYTDKMGMAAGVEVRVPFLDLDLVALAARIPARAKQRGRSGKWVLKQAMQPFLPADIIYRPKSGFGAPIRRWFRSELRPLLRETLSEERLRRRGLFDPNAVQRLILDNENGTVDAAYLLLSLLSIELWCDAFLDKRCGRVESLP
jgi:asparagine synthase (glutamine-hydrolysing)